MPPKVNSPHRPTAQASPSDRPRRTAAVPQPYTSKPGQQSQLEEKLQEFKAENQLLGQLLQDVQAERRVLEGRLAEAREQLSQQAGLVREAEKESQGLQLAVQQLQQQAHDKDQQLERAHGLQRELEDLVILLNERCNQQATLLVEAAAQEAQQQQQLQQQQQHLQQLQPQQQHARIHSSPSRLSPKRSPIGKALRQAPSAVPDANAAQQHLESLRQAEHAHAQKLRRLQQRQAAELERMQRTHDDALVQLRQDSRDATAAQEEQQRHAQAQLRRQTLALVAQIKQAAEAEVRRCMHALERQAQDQLRILEQLDKRVSLLGAQSQRLKDSLPTRDQGRPFRAEAEATAAAATERRYVTAIKEAEREVLQLRGQIDALVSEKQQLSSNVAVIQLAEAAQRQQARDAAARAQRARDEVVKYSEEVHSLLGANAELLRDKVLSAEQIAAAEEAIKGLRSEVAMLRVQLVDAKVEHSEVLLSTARAANKRHQQQQAPGSHDALRSVPTAVEATLQQVQGVMRDALVESQYLEQKARSLLSCARNEQVAAQRALLLQVRRMQALEAMRMADMQELSRVSGAAASAVT